MCIKRLHSTYTNRGFVLDHMLVDFEFEYMRPITAILGINLNTTSASEHVCDIKRYIRLLKERLCGLANTLPFTKYPKLMKIVMVNFCVFQLNIFLEKAVSKFTLVLVSLLTEVNLILTYTVVFLLVATTKLMKKILQLIQTLLA